MADDVQVKFGASLTGLVEGTKQANEALKGFADQAKGHAERITSGFSKVQETMIGVAAVLAGGAMFKEFVSSTVETISQVQGLQKSLGMTLDDANKLKSSLDFLGMSTDSYREMATKLDRQIRAGSESLTKMGITAKDLALGQVGLMDKAIETLGKYKEGVDRNIAAQVLFGRGGADAAKLLKLGLEEVKTRSHELEESLGLAVTKKNLEDARSYKLAMNEVGMAFEGIKKAIGEQVLPYLTRFAEWFVSVAPQVIAGMKGTVSSVVSWMFQAVAAIGGFVITAAELIDSLIKKLNELKTVVAGMAGGALAGAIGGGVVAGPIGALGGAVGGAVVGSYADDLIQSNKKAEGAVTDFQGIREKFKSQLELFENMLRSGPTSELGKGGGMPKGTLGAEGLVGGGGGGNADALKAMNGQIQIIQAGLATKKALYDIDEATFSLTELGKVNAVRTATEQAYQQELAVMQRTLAVTNLNAAQRQSVEDKIAVLKQKHITDNLQLELQSIQVINARYTEFFSSLQGSFNAQLRGLLAGTTSWKNAFKTIVGDMVIFFIEAVEKMVFKWIAGKLTMLTMDKSTAAASAAVDAAGNAASAASAVALIQQKVAEVYAGAAAFFAPLLGPGAPAAAAGVAGAVDATATGMALAGAAEQGAWEIPATSPWLLHKGETVLPAPAGQAFRDMAESGSLGGSGATIHMSTIDGASVARFFRQHAGLAVKIFGDHAALNRG